MPVAATFHPFVVSLPLSIYVCLSVCLSIFLHFHSDILSIIEFLISYISYRRYLVFNAARLWLVSLRALSHTCYKMRTINMNNKNPGVMQRHLRSSITQFADRCVPSSTGNWNATTMLKFILCVPMRPNKCVTESEEFEITPTNCQIA